MIVKINNIKKYIISGISDTLETNKIPKEQIFKDPKGKYAVVEIFKKEAYIGLKIISDENEMLVGEYVDHYYYDNYDCYLINYTIDWSYMKYGFCKLIRSMPEIPSEFYRTVKRFYFDFELYKNNYEKENGVPCPKKDHDK